MLLTEDGGVAADEVEIAERPWQLTVLKELIKRQQLAARLLPSRKGGERAFAFTHHSENVCIIILNSVPQLG